MLGDIVWLIALTLVPGLELRASIPYGLLATDMNWLTVFVICVIVNALLGPLVFILLKLFVGLLRKSKALDKLYKKSVERAQKSIHSYVERWGVFGLSIFIGIPLPGSGSYTGALGAHVLGFDFKKFVLANLLGVLIAGIIVTAVTLTGSGLFSMFVKVI